VVVNQIFGEGRWLVAATMRPVDIQRACGSLPIAIRHNDRQTAVRFDVNGEALRSVSRRYQIES
jgi:hypothetical protein